jgi:hypothetical protein
MKSTETFSFILLSGVSDSRLTRVTNVLTRQQEKPRHSTKYGLAVVMQTTLHLRTQHFTGTYVQAVC